MKKVALLFTILCVSILNGMENHRNHNGSHLENLSVEAQAALNAAFKTGKLDTVINTIKEISDIDNELYNNVLFNMIYVIRYLKEFTTLVHILAKEFKMDPYKIAEKFKTPTAKRYVELYKQLEKQILNKQNITETKKLIAEGADVTANPMLLFLALLAENPTTTMIKLLLENGANPFVTDKDGRTPLEYLNAVRKNIPKYAPIKSLFENAMKKQE
jgi:hypothetical protein